MDNGVNGEIQRKSGVERKSLFVRAYDVGNMFLVMELLKHATSIGYESFDPKYILPLE